MGRAIRRGSLILASGLLLACDRERVDLRGNGAGGSSSPTLLASPGSRALPAAAGRIAPPPVASGTLPTPASASFIATPPASPFVALQPRAELTPPIAGGTLAVAADGGLAVVSDPDRDALFVIDLAGGDMRRANLPGQSEAGRVVLDDMHHAHVVLRNDGRLARVDLNNLSVSLSEPLCQQPRGVAYAAGTKSLHVACADGQLVQLSAADYSELAREQHDNDLRDILVRNDGTRIVSRFRSAELLWLSASKERTTSAPVLPRATLTKSVNGQELSSVDTAATFGFRIQSVGDTEVWMLHERAQVDALAADAHYYDRDTGCGPVVQPALTMFGNDGSVPGPEYNLQLPGVAGPAVDLAISSGSDGWVAIATPAAYAAGRPTVRLQRRAVLQEQAQIRPLDESNAEFKLSPNAACAQPSFIGLEIGSQAVAVAFDQSGLLYVQSRYPARLDVYQPLAADPSRGTDWRAHWINDVELASDEVRDLGQEWFHAELGSSGLSCAACHAEGLDDAHTWMFGAKPRRTPSLRGGIKQTAPFSWDGAFASFDALLTDVVTRQVSAPNISADASAAMLNWLDRLPALSFSTNAPAAMSGKMLFESSALGCASCHSGLQLTDNQSVSLNADAGVADEALQVPSLLGLALRAPFMHDGCASDLSVLFRDPACARAMHKPLAALSGADAEALQAYLLSL